jgi:hypothetical protein
MYTTVVWKWTLSSSVIIIIINMYSLHHIVCELGFKPCNGLQLLSTRGMYKVYLWYLTII